MADDINPADFPPCTRCGHTLEEHERPPDGTKLPWPCRHDGCDCPGFVVSRDLREDVKHMAGLRLESAIRELFPEHMRESEVFARVVRLVREIKDALGLPDEDPDDHRN